MILTDDLLIQILIRLPEKSVYRFRCVSKSWLSLISDPHFTKWRSEFIDKHKERILLFLADDSEIRFINFNAPSLCDSSASVVVKLNFLPSQPSCFSNRILGSCRGFLLIDCYPNLCLCNPITGFHTQLPQCPTYSYADAQTLFPFLNVHGFGYNPSTDDYIVTVMSYDPTRFSYFSVKGNSWKELEGISLPYKEDEEFDEPKLALLFNGAIHWFARRHDRLVDVIVVFDLVDKSFSEMNLPRHFDGNLNRCKLRIFGESISICTAGNMWVMKEYQVQSSWSRRDIVVPPHQNSTGLEPICCTKRGDTIGINARNDC